MISLKQLNVRKGTIMKKPKLLGSKTISGRRRATINGCWIGPRIMTSPKTAEMTQSKILKR